MAIAFVQAKELGGNGGDFTTVVTLDSAVTAGNLLVAIVDWGGSGAAVETVSGGGTWTRGPKILQSADGESVALWYCLSATGGSTTVTASYDVGAGFRGLIVAEYSGGTWSTDVSSSAQTNSTTSWNSGSATVAAGALVVGGCYMGDTNTVNAGSGYTKRITVSSVAFGQVLEDKVQGASGSTNASFTMAAGGGNASAVMQSFTVSAGGAKTGDAAIAATDTITASGVVGKVATAALAATVAITATAVVGKVATASINATGTITAAGSVAASGDKVGSASLAATDTITATGVVGVSSAASIAATATISATASVSQPAKFATASLAAVATITATATVMGTGPLVLSPRQILPVTAQPRILPVRLPTQRILGA